MLVAEGDDNINHMHLTLITKMLDENISKLVAATLYWQHLLILQIGSKTAIIKNKT